MFVRIFLLFMLSVAITGRYFLFTGINNVNVCKSIFQIIIIVFDMPDFYLFFWGGGGMLICGKRADLQNQQKLSPIKH